MKRNIIIFMSMTMLLSSCTNDSSTRNLMLVAIVMTVISSSMLVDKITAAKRRTEIRNRLLKRDIEKLEKEKERYMEMYNEVQAEKEVLTGMREDGELSDEMRVLLEERMKVLNSFITAYISGNCSEQAYTELEKLMSNRKGFIDSTRLSFAIAHPRFLIFLKEKGLTDLEIGYCCLYTLGLKGKDVGDFIQKKRHYIISSEIRKKLGLGEHDTNIGIWLRDLLSRTQDQQM